MRIDPHYKVISDLNDLKDRIDIWIWHNQQPEAYDSPAEDLSELASRLARIAGDATLASVKDQE